MWYCEVLSNDAANVVLGHWYPCTTKELRICKFYRRGYSISLLRVLECSLHMGFKVMTNVWLTRGKTWGGITSFYLEVEGLVQQYYFASSQCGMFLTYTKLLIDWVLLRTNGKMDMLDLTKILKDYGERVIAYEHTSHRFNTKPWSNIDLWLVHLKWSKYNS